ncbi:DoxX family protein [Corynebacterium suranareeae]|uniref:DoxX family protein n=1 Tax=Corynebacterium suranareeae TaxID=2506452 RepID=A0A160PNJ5_9CORY|nr:DoxX family protein [Corynebacterium suranareeae]BAU94855.1 DoxX family protein [Corynebacterium suranareeae]
MSTIKEISFLLARILLGVILIAHGWDKFAITGLEGVTGFFGSLGIPAAGFAAILAALIELVGGILIILGAFTRIVGAIVALDMLLAALFAHVSSGIFVSNNGWELVGAIGAGALLLIAAGAGAWSIDAALAKRKA